MRPDLSEDKVVISGGRGMKSAENFKKSLKAIVAINKDEEAPTFSVADYGLAAKWEDTLPALVDKVKAIRASK